MAGAMVKALQAIRAVHSRTAVPGKDAHAVAEPSRRAFQDQREQPPSSQTGMAMVTLGFFIARLEMEAIANEFPDLRRRPGSALPNYRFDFPTARGVAGAPRGTSCYQAS